MNTLKSPSAQPSDLTNVVNDLSSLLTEKAFHEQQRVRTEVETIYTQVSEGASVASAQRLADYYTLEHRLAIIDLDAKIEVLYLMKDLLCRS